MARYQLRRPMPVKVVPRRIRRQATITSSAPAPGASAEPKAEAPEEEVEEGPESPDSPFSSPSTVGGSESEDSESDDDEEPPSPPAAEQAASSGQSILPSVGPSSAASMPSAISSAPAGTQASSTVPRPISTSTATSMASQMPASQIASSQSSASQTRVAQPAFTASFSSQGNVAVAPQITISPSLITTTRLASTTVAVSASSADASRPADTQPSSSIIQSLAPAQSETAGQNEAPQRSSPQEEKTMITKGGAAAAITLSIIGAIAIVVAAVIFLKRRKRRHYNQRLPDDPFNPGNTGSLAAPETAYVITDSPLFIAGGGGGSHLTRSTNRSDSLFGAAPYARPETVSTERNRSRFPVAPPQPTPNPFADPPLNKAYDVLAGRPRSTTLTDRGSWVKNPFRNPESERFDPFGELQEKARMERKRYVDEARREAELAREAEVQRQFGEKEKMGLGVPEEVRRKGSGVTIEGLGVLDRSGGPSAFQ